MEFNSHKMNIDFGTKTEFIDDLGQLIVNASLPEWMFWFAF